MNKQKQLDSILNILGTKINKNHSGRKINKMVDRHIWTIQEELDVIELYNYNPNEQDILDFVETSELKLTSVKMKLLNIKYLDTGEGLKNVSNLTRDLFFRRN